MRPIRTIAPLALGLVALAVAGCQSRPDQPTAPAPTPIERAAPPTIAPGRQAPPPSRPPATTPKPKPGPETIVGLWPVRTLEQARMLQDGADAGHQPWLLSPELVATSDGAAELDLYQPVARRVGPNAYEVGATGSEWAAKLYLAQPVRRGRRWRLGHHPDHEPRGELLGWQILRDRAWRPVEAPMRRVRPLITGSRDSSGQGHLADGHRISVVAPRIMLCDGMLHRRYCLRRVVLPPPPSSGNVLPSCILNEQLTKPRPLEAAMTDVDDFLAEIHPRLVAELQALHNGDPQPRLAMWSTKDPVTLFGAGMSGRGWDKLSGIFRSIASRWSDCTDQRVEILAAGVSGDLAYTVELEHTSVSLDGAPVDPYTLRVTQVYRREDGQWKIVHRHGDQLSIDQIGSLPGAASTA